MKFLLNDPRTTGNWKGFTVLNLCLILSSLGTDAEHTPRNTHGQKVGHTCHTSWVLRSEKNYLCHLEVPVKIQRHKHNHNSSKCRHFYNALDRGHAGCVFPACIAGLVASQWQGQLLSLQGMERVVYRIRIQTKLKAALSTLWEAGKKAQIQTILKEILSFQWTVHMHSPGVYRD